MTWFRLLLAFTILWLPLSVSAQSDAESPPSEDTATETENLTEAQKQQRARVHYDRGLQLVSEEAYSAALLEFERAYELSPSYKILYNLGSIHVFLNEFAAALGAYERYLEEGGERIPAARRAEVRKEIRALTVRVGVIRIEINIEGAEVRVDNRIVGTSPLSEPVRVDPGRHRVEASKQGFVAASRVVTVVGSDVLAVALKLEEPETRVERRTIVVAEDPRPRRRALAAWISSGAVLLGGVTTGVFALRAANDLDDAKAAGPAQRADLDSKSDNQKKLTIITDVLLGVAVAGVGISTYLSIVAGKKKKEHERENQATDVSFGPTSIWVTGSF